MSRELESASFSREMRQISFLMMQIAVTSPAFPRSTLSASSNLDQYTSPSGTDNAVGGFLFVCWACPSSPRYIQQRGIGPGDRGAASVKGPAAQSKPRKSRHQAGSVLPCATSPQTNPLYFSACIGTVV